MNSEYYIPPAVFRQPAIFVKKQQAYDGDNGRARRSWKTDASKMNSPFLRKVSGDMNDSITTKKLRKEVWSLPSDGTVSSFAVDEELVLFSTTGNTNRLHLYELREDTLNNCRHKLHSLQKITVPGACILETDLIQRGFNETIKNYDTGLHDRALLTGHSDGMVNLVATSTIEGDAKILRRFDHSRYLKVTREGNTSGLDAELFNSRHTTPIKYLKSWREHCFLSQINESVFIYDINQQTKVPLYLQSFSGLESVDPNPNSQYILSLTGTRFGEEGVAILDLRAGKGDSGLHVPKSSGKETGKAIASKWLDEYTLCSSIGSSLKLWDIRYGGTKADFYGHKGYIESLMWDAPSENLYTADDQGLIMSWDLSTLKGMGDVVHCSPSHGIHSFTAPANSLQCGSIIQSPDVARLEKGAKVGTSYFGVSHSKLITLKADELCCISRFDSPLQLPPPRSPLRLQKSEPNHSIVSSCSSSEDAPDEVFSTIEDSDETLDSEFSSPILSPFLDSHEVKNDTLNAVPFLSGMRRYSDDIFG